MSPAAAPACRLLCCQSLAALQSLRPRVVFINANKAPACPVYGHACSVPERLSILCCMSQAAETELDEATSMRSEAQGLGEDDVIAELAMVEERLQVCFTGWLLDMQPLSAFAWLSRHTHCLDLSVPVHVMLLLSVCLLPHPHYLQSHPSYLACTLHSRRTIICCRSVASGRHSTAAFALSALAHHAHASHTPKSQVCLSPQPCTVPDAHWLGCCRQRSWSSRPSCCTLRARPALQRPLPCACAWPSCASPPSPARAMRVPLPSCPQTSPLSPPAPR